MWMSLKCVKFDLQHFFKICFFKDIPDARKIRSRIIRNIELSLHPGLSESERKQLLNFVIVGGGPTGVEFGAELYDWIEQV